MERQQKVLITTDPTIFKRLKGNRMVENKRVAIIKASIESVGYIKNPIIVNQKLEIIDGQGRKEALTQLGMPIEYIVMKNLGIEECRAMNLKPTSWTMVDFVRSYAEYGNENYIRLIEIADRWRMGYSLVYNIQMGSTGSAGSRVESDLRSGEYILTETKAKELDETCRYLSELKDVQKRIGGRKDVFYSCIAWIIHREGVDANRLKVALKQQSGTITPPAKAELTLKEMSEAYNKGYSKKNRRFFDYEWKTRGN